MCAYPYISDHYAEGLCAEPKDVIAAFVEGLVQQHQLHVAVVAFSEDLEGVSVCVCVRV